MLDLDSVRAFVGELHKSCADGRVYQLPMIAHELDLGIDDAMFVGEERRKLADEDVAVLVNGRSEHGTSMLLVPGGVVRAAAKERDAIWRPRDNHATLSPWRSDAPAGPPSFGCDNLARRLLCHGLERSAF